jgi:two-component system sensor histidine kinase HydH
MTSNDARRGDSGWELVKALRIGALSGGFTVDRNGVITNTIGGAEQILGLAPGELNQKRIQTLPKSLLSVLEDCGTKNNSLPKTELEFFVASRGNVRIETSVLCLTAGPNPPLAAILTDLTSIMNLEREIRRLDRLASVGTLSASMAHEVKNALVAGKTFIDLLIEKHQDEDLVEVVRHEMSRIDSIVSQVLRFSGRSRPLPSTTGLHELLDHCLALLQPEIQRKLISLRSVFGAQEDSINCDPHQLQQAFMNVLLNSLEAMNEGGSLNVSTELLPPDPSLRETDTSFARKRIRVSIQDSGSGISAENLGQLFEPFFTTKPNGTGLGLPITRQILREHHGTIEVSSEPGKGTSFTIVLPIAGEDPVAPNSPRTPS